jgi:23S rRNA pseudouridine2605 synthase
MRLNKYLSQSGIASRRSADEMTLAGNVKVNGLPMKTLGYDVKDGDVVEVNGQIAKGPVAHVYYAMNKPPGYITSMRDERDRQTVMSLASGIPERVFPVGRLDFDTSGLLILTNDGDLAQRLSHPKHKTPKTYLASVDGILSRERINKLAKGVDIGGFTTSPAEVRVLKQMPHYAEVEITIYEGKNRQVRKMFTAVGNKVLTLKRVAIGEIRLGRTKEGHYRKLSREEVAALWE